MNEVFDAIFQNFRNYNFTVDRIHSFISHSYHRQHVVRLIFHNRFANVTIVGRDESHVEVKLKLYVPRNMIRMNRDVAVAYS